MAVYRDEFASISIFYREDCPFQDVGLYARIVWMLSLKWQPVLGHFPTDAKHRIGRCKVIITDYSISDPPCLDSVDLPTLNPRDRVNCTS